MLLKYCYASFNLLGKLDDFLSTYCLFFLICNCLVVFYLHNKIILLIGDTSLITVKCLYQSLKKWSLMKEFDEWIFFCLLLFDIFMTDRINELVNNVKELIQEGKIQTEQCIKNIDNEIDSKQNQIRELFGENIDSVINYFIQYHHVISQHKRIEESCEEFNKNIEKNQKLNAYDQQQIQKCQKNLESLRSIKKKLAQYKNYINVAQKAALNIKEEKYNNAIKIINQYKKNLPKLDTPLKRVLPTLEKKVEEHLKKLLDTFWDENKVKMQEIGKNCFNKLSSNYQQKLNIYQLFFGSNIRASGINPGMSSFRCTMLTKQTSSRILKDSDDNNDYLNKVMVRINVEMSTIKRVKVMQVELNNQAAFNEMLKNSLKDYLLKIEEEKVCEKQQQFIELLSILIGFLLIKREVCAFFDLKLQQKVFINQIYSLIQKQIKNVIDCQKTVQVVKKLKDYLLIFHKILNLLQLNENNQRYNQIVQDLLKCYNNRNLAFYQASSPEVVAKDNLTHYSTQDSQKETLMFETFNITSQSQIKFTSYVGFTLDCFFRTYEDVNELMQQSDINRNAIYQSLTSLYDKIINVYGSSLLEKNQHFQIIQGQVNLIYIDKIYRYLVRQLEIYHGIITQNKISERYEQLIVKLTRNILEGIRVKIEKLMEDYHEMNPNKINEEYNEFVQWTLQFIFHIIDFMKQINCPNYESIIIETMREMCELYWNYLKSLKEVNLIIIHNLNLDLSFIYKFCNENFKDLNGIFDKFRSLRQFYSLMLTNNIQDLLEPQKRAISYPNLNIETAIMIMKKYNQTSKTDGKIRELRKKDVQNLLKKLVQVSK